MRSRDAGTVLVRMLPRDPAGLCGAAVLWLAGLAPSLLPRATVIAIALAGLLAAIGYAAGCAIGWVVRAAVRRVPAARMASLPIVVRVLAALLWAAALVMTVLAESWQADQLALLGVPGDPAPWWLVTVGGLLLAWALVGVARGLAAVTRRTAARVGHHAARPVAVAVGVLASVGIVVAVVALGYSATWAAFAHIDRLESGAQAPTSPLRSGGPGSLVAFETLGAEGRAFVTGGPTVAAITGYAGTPATEPIRVFVGLDSAPDDRARARLAVDELRRTGAFSRRLIVVATTTGNGFLDPALVAAPELLEAGDVATVAMQYSVLPSWLSFLVDQGAAGSSANALLAAVEQAIAVLPEGERPALAVAGESLGAFGSQASFAGMSPEQVVERVDAAVWIGSPGASAVWPAWRDSRSSGPEWQPVIGDSTVARNPATADSPLWSQPGWGPRRVVLTQHANDPVSWWSPSLILGRPGWLDDPRGPGVDARTTWWPLVLFLQAGLDLAAAGAQPPGVGHDYADVTGQAWAYALSVPGQDGGAWQPSDTARLSAALG